MSDIIDHKNPGKILSEHRKMKKISIEDVAASLKLSISQIQAIEEGNFDFFSGKLFVHGYVRNYAKFLEIDPTKLVEDIKYYYQDKFDTQDQKEETEEYKPKVNDKSKMPIYSFVSILIIFIIGFIIFSPGNKDIEKKNSDSKATLFNDQSNINNKSDKKEDKEKDIKSGLNTKETIIEDVPSNSLEIIDENQTSAPIEEVEYIDIKNKILIVFNEESWVEIKYEEGDIVFAGVGLEGERKVLETNAPTSIIIGNAPGVKMFYNDQEVDLAKFTKITVARLKLE